MIHITEVTTKAQLRQFVNFPIDLYRDVPQYIPGTYSDDLADWDREKNPAFSYCEARCWLASRDDGTLVGRIGAILSRKSNDKWGTHRLRFTQVDFIDDREVSAALKKHDGRLFPTGWADVLKAFHRNDTIDLLLIAVRPDLQKKGVNAVIISKVMHGCFKIGVKQAETGPMLETNEKVQTQWQDFPLEQHKRRRCFVKVLTPAPQESAATATAPVGAAE